MADHITVVGNVATAPERRTLTGGGSVVSFRLATTERRRDAATGTWTDGHTNWFRVSAYRALGDNVLASFQKGERIVVTGRYRLRTWDTAGTPGHEAEIDADALGHDLRWGTSSFARSASEQGASVASDRTSTSTVAESAAEWAPVAGSEPPF